ncbi:hypothetical protein NDR87_02835 [Nocardia sp. CDC159]|uniref:Integral membrane protein n=1 Tax=Nocardia pulmonis TaxID=2951408 RepID=A0A9X2E5L9_9NOCA|nr:MULTISPECIES: hypothetical protein [Nocardia]MCM6772051.1 hypothetical protein [Nocardia pulmonis]MCM6785291.1 hypothetical protein [Nocardia sp. CDC159]
MPNLTLPAARHGTASRADLVCAGVAVALVAIAMAVPRILGEQWDGRLSAGAAPLIGAGLPHAGWGTVPAIAIAGLVIAYGPSLAHRLPWRALLALTWFTAVCWAFALAMVDGWQRGFAGRLSTGDAYLPEVGGITGIGPMLREFSGRILDFQPNSWPAPVAGHPPGALLTFVLLDRIGLGGGAWAAWLCTLAGCSAAVAVAVTLRALGSEQRARAATPFLALAPAAVWLAVSADALFAGVTAWAVALLALALRGHGDRLLCALCAGLLFGVGLHLGYGLVLMAIPAAAVVTIGLAAARPAAYTFRPVLVAAVGLGSIVAVFVAAGFWWYTGHPLAVQRYYQATAAERPNSYWVWANLAATACALGPATAAALHRVRPELTRTFSVKLATPQSLWRPHLASAEPVALLAAAGLAAILMADLSGLSKAETERIWLPFDMWVLAAAALLPARGTRLWLAAQAATALLVNHLVLTNW